MTNAWSLTYDDYDVGEEGLREALLTLGNGYFATRGAAAEASADGTHYPGTYVAGLYNRLDTEVSGRTVTNEDLVNVPNWLVLRLRIDDGDWIDLGDVEVLDYRRELDLRRGHLTRHVEFRDSQGRETAFTQRRFVSMENPHIAGQQTALVAQNWSGTVTFRAGIDGNIINSGVARYRELASRHLEVLDAGTDDDVAHVEVETTQSRVRIAQAARTRVYTDDVELAVDRTPVIDGGFAAHDLHVDVVEGAAVTVEKIVVLHTSRDHAITEALTDAVERVSRAGRYDDLLNRHVQNWNHLWRRFDIQLDVDDRVQMIVRLHLFHLLQTVSLNSLDLDVGAPARGWHGEAYRGHIFWDELFIFPVLNLRLPVLTQALLRYRRRRLDEARLAAVAEGHRGAMYPWQSGSNGREETQQLHLNPKSGRWLPDHSHLQRHINIAVAWNVWESWEVTSDIAFLRHEGAPMLIEIARFLASLATYNRALDRYEMLGVMGPDEYHEAYPDRDTPGLDNNAYTNIMTVWVLLRALELLDRVAPYQRDELCEQLELMPDELDRWVQITHKMAVPFHAGDDGDPVISQFAGYENLEEFDWEGYRERYGNISRLDRILEAEGDTTNRYRLSKQPDVLMLFYLLSADRLEELFSRLGYDFDTDLLLRTIDYYSARTSHGSTLSSVVHSWVLARSHRERSWEFFRRALEADISDVQGGTTPEGIHLGAMAGSVDLILRGYGGIVTRGGVLRFDPHLPPELGSVRFQLSYRGQQLQVHIDQQALTITSFQAPAAPVRIAVASDERMLETGTTVEFPISST